MSNRVRIRTNPQEFGGKHLKVKLEQSFDFLEILSLSISQEEVYRRFCSDYGVVVGRVIMNNGVGVPNAKVSIFVPIDEEDLQDEEIRDLYPFETINDKDPDGKRYNLLPNSSQFDCHTPVGTLATKREILDNDLKLDIHCKYYKYSAITNAAGDYMIFGVPTGTHFINIDCDLSDIGIYSQRPYDFMAVGQPRSSFETSNKFKGGEDLNKLNQIKNQQTSVNIRPFWGDEDQCSIGITRLDVDLKHELKPSAIFMGGIFGDNEKNSINKRCKPRKKLGSLCETVAGAGTIEMLRKDLDGKNQRFDVDGGRVIDDNGAWAYQVPMNLDYMITNEYGDLVPTEDSTRGIPTRASVRFKIGMDVTGGEGKIRTRAKYLVPHNPNNYNETDYSFDESTGHGLNGDKHFKDMYWNKIYSVKNFIPRFQTMGGLEKVGTLSPDVSIRAMLGIKDVDDCTGLHNPFPFNRMDSDINPLFSILCIIIKIISFIVILINTIIITLINAIIFILNAVLIVICEVVFFVGKIACALKYPLDADSRKECRKNACIGDCEDECDDCDCKDIIPYIPCITLSCQDEEYGPGCFQGGKPLPWAATDKPPMKHWPNDGHTGHGTLETVPIGDAGWSFCISLTLAEALNVWEFDFYNDWVNGSLYSFLLKYKKKRKDKEKFCEFDCDDFSGGVDGDNNGNPDNKCQNNWLVDSCTADGVKTGESALIRDGLVKSYQDELYYAAFTHEAGYKLFATDIIDLGAMFECDWQGKPKIQPFLVPTSYKAPELLNEYDDTTGELVTSGYDSPGLASNTPSLFFDISCLGLTTTALNCTNIKRQCEIGVGLDELRTDESTPLGCVPVGGGAGEADVKINNCDIDNLFIRDAFTQLNNPYVGIDLSDTVTASRHALFDSGAISSYELFRDIQNKLIKQPWGGSYYFYFGLTPNKTGLDKMNTKYFENCSIIEEDDFLITGVITDVTTYGGSDGSVDVTIVGGTGPYTYVWSNGATSEDITGVPAGTYTVTVTDAEGLQATTTFNVGQPFAVNCFASATPVSSNGASDGTIQIVGIGGGIGPYTTEIVGPVTVTHSGIVGPTDMFAGLPTGTYVVTTTDSASQSSTCSTSGVIITSPPALTMSGTSSNITCNGASNGSIQFNYITGVAPVTSVTTVVPPLAGYPLNNQTLQTGLDSGTYTVTMTDNIGQTASQVFTITQPTAITGNITPQHITCNGAANGVISVTGLAGGTPPYNSVYSWDGPTPSPIVYTGPTLQPIGTLAYPAGIYTATVTDSNGCIKDFTVEVLEPPVLLITLVSKTNVTCNGGSNGQITVSVSGGNPAIGFGTYQVRIDGGPWIGISTSHIFTGLASGSHTIAARDTQHLCTAPNLIVSLTQPTVVTVAPSSTSQTSVTVSGSGGNGGPYQFRIGAGTWQASPVFTGLACGTGYSFQARDAQNCTSASLIISTNAC